MTNKTSLSNRLSAFSFRLLALCIVHCALCISTASAVTITASATAVGAGDVTPVQAEISGGTVDHLYLVYQISGSSYAWNTNEMESVSATLYTSFIPPLIGAVNVQWYVTDGTVSSATMTTTFSALPDYSRYHDGAQVSATPHGWEKTSGTNYIARTENSEWVANAVGLGTQQRYVGAIAEDIGMAFPVIYFHNYPPSADPYIRSPKLQGGVGTIDFRTALTMQGMATPEASGVPTSELKIQIAYTENDPGEEDWIDIEGQTYKYGTKNGGVFTHICHVVLNDYSVTYVRILRSGFNTESPETTGAGRLVVDNICITKPAANVGIIEKLKNPGYPAADQNILMRCAVTNVCEETPAVNRRVTVKYQYRARDTYQPDASASAWSSADMAYMGKDSHGLDWYEGTIPTQRVGYVWYYYQVDYDGYAWNGTLENGAATESLSPAYWDAGEDTHVRPIAGTKFQVRPYRSRYGRIALEATPPEASVSEMTLVDDEQWQGVTLVSGISIVSNYFIGYGYYEDDAEAYETTPVIWGENNPDALSDPTLAGFLESTHDTQVTNQLIALNVKGYKGTYLYRFSSNDKDAEAAGDPEGDRRYDYIVKKAVYQDFNDWTASPIYYETSLGGLPTLTFSENFDGNAGASTDEICVRTPWEGDGYATDDSKKESFQDEELSDEYSTKASKTEGNFLRTGSRIIADRKTSNKQTLVNKTLALNLGGLLENTSDSLPDGLEKITFKARASVDDSNFAMYKNGTSWALSANNSQLFVNATWQLTQMAPSKPYLSYIFLYHPDLWDPLAASWYEVRIIQTDSADANNNTVRVELWRKDAGAKAAVFAAAATAAPKYYLNNSRAVNIRASNNSNKFRAQVSFTGNTTYQADVTDPTAKSDMLTQGGTIGFGVFDAVPNITAVKAGANNGGNELLDSLKNTYQNWSTGGQHNGQPRWTITSGAITRTVPEQTLGIYAANCVGGEDQAKASELPSTPNATVTMNTLSMRDYTVSFKAWNRKFVQISYDNGDGGVVLDDVVYHPWRAMTRTFERGGADLEVGNDHVSYLDWTSIDQQEMWLDQNIDTTGDSMRQRWAVFEGWVTNSGAFRVGAEFERTRANTNLVQGVVSPELLNGIGSCSFSYDVRGGKVVYGVECTATNNYHIWIPVAVYTNAPGDSGERYAKVGKYYSGRIRVRIYGANDVGSLLAANEDCGYEPAWGYTDEAAKIKIDNLRVKDYPKDENDNAWNAYNLLITGDAPDGQVYNNSGKSCFFNNSPTDGVYGAEEFTEFDPYLESPPLSGVGVGEIAFQYRLVPGTAQANTDGTLVIKVAPRRDTPLNEWKTITNLVVSSSGTAFVKFDNEKIFDENNYVVRFYNSKLPNTPRIVIDNVLVTAPARPSFEFEYVKLLPEQPLAGTNTVVEAKIMREVMNPKGIRIYVSWHKYDTNNVNDVWGVANWFNPLTSPKVELRSVADKVYRTPEGSGIPAFDVDDIVEFVVWGVHDDINVNAGDSPIKQDETTFEVPEWYRTVDFDYKEVVAMDMNVDKEEEGWSPYYWVFSCPPGTFFINEFNNWRTDTTACDKGSPEYIEFAGIGGTDIGGWRLVIVHNQNDAGYKDMEYVIPAGTRLRTVTETGWGFFVWGDSCSSANFIINEGGDYERPNVPFNVDAAFPDSADPADRHLGNYAGVVIYRSNGMVEESLRFGTKTVSVFTGEDAIWGLTEENDKVNRKTSNKTASISRFSLNGARPGATAADFVWWPKDVTGDNNPYGDEYAEFFPAQTPGAPNTAQVFAEFGGGGVVAALYYPDGTEITSADVLAWIEHYGAEQSDIDALGTKAKVDEEFLLNLDLTKTCVAELKITSIEVEDGYVYLGVQLTRTENNVAVGRRKINGTLKLLGRADLAAGTFTALQPDSYDSNFETGNSIEIEYELPVNNPPKFFKVIVE